MAAHQSPSHSMPHHRPPYLQNGSAPPNAQPPPPPQHQPQHQQAQAPQRAQLSEYLAHTNEATWLQMGRTAERMAVYPTAIYAYERALSYNGYNLDALRALATALRATDQYTEAIGHLETILRIEPNHGESWSSLGHCYLMLDELQKAYAAYQSALYNLHDPQEPKLWYGIGILYDRYGSLDHAEEAFSQVMRMAPDFEKANEIYFRLGIIYKQQLKFAESLECFQWIANNPPSPLNQTDILFQIGHVYEQQKDYESAKEAYRRVLERDPNHAKVLQQLGWLYHQESNDYASQEQAIVYLEKSVSSDQNDAQSWYLLGRCYMSQQKFPKAYEAYQQAVYRDGRNPTFWCSIGVLYYQINQYRDALDAYSRAIRLNPNISEVWYDLGTLYESCNNQTSDALDAYQRAAELDPNNQHIKSRLQFLRNNPHSGGQMQNGAPLPHDGHPTTYEPVAVNGPPQPSWAPTLPQSSSHRGGPSNAPPPPQSQPNGPPQPINETRDWHQQPADAQHQAGRPWADPRADPRDQHSRFPNHPAMRQQSPRVEHLRHQETQRHTPTQRPPSPPSRGRNTMPSGPRGPPPMAQGPPLPQPPEHQPPSNRVANPNYGAPTIPPMAMPPTQNAPGHNNTYGRPASPLPEVRPIVENHPRSPHNSYSRPGPPHSAYEHHPNPSAPSNIASGAPPPSSAQVAEAAAARDREDRTSGPPSAPKRHREWEDRPDEGGIQKKLANEESRARLDDPHNARSASPYSRDREGGRGLYGGPTSYPSEARRVEEQRIADENYKPSEHAHHPAPLNTIMHQERPVESSSRNHSRNSSAPGSAKREPTSPKVEESRRAEPTSPKQDFKKDHDGDVSMRSEEPAARKMDVDENYDDDSAEESNRSKARAGNFGASGSNSQGESKASSTTVNGQHSTSNGDHEGN